jgi:hypothetical protein
VRGGEHAPPPREHEIVAAGPLLAPDGRVREPGFARRPLLRYNPEAIALTPFAALNRLRLKEWDFYAITTGAMSFSMAVAHGGLAGVAAAQVIEFAGPRLLERVVVTPLGAGCALPLSSEAGDVRFRRRGVEIDLVVRPGRRELRVRWPRYLGADDLALDAVVTEPSSHESILMATPIGARGFYMNRKICGLATSGSLSLGARREDLGAAGALATLDWGRGVWPYRTLWTWASGAGRLADGRVLGLNLGGGFGDLRAATENCLFLDGRMHKLGPVDFAYDRADPAAGEWRMRDREGRLDLRLGGELYAMRKSLNALVIRSDLRQVTGAFRGWVVTEAGERIEVGGDGDRGWGQGRVIGWAEEHRARW